MLKTTKKLLTLLFAPLLLAGALFANDTRYVCKTDNAYEQYMIGALDNLSSAVFYDDNTLCRNNCRDYKPCEPREINDVKFLIQGASSLSLADTASIEGMAHGAMYSKVEVIADGEYYVFEPSTPIAGSAFSFPEGVPGFGSLFNEVSNTVHSDASGHIKFIRIPTRSETEPLCQSGDTLIDGQCYNLTGDSFDINATNPCPPPHLTQGTVCRERTVYAPNRCESPAYFRGGKCVSFSSSSATYTVEVSQDGRTKRLGAGKYIDPLTGDEFDRSFHLNAYSIGSGFTCNPLRGMLREGDLNDNLFSSQNACEAHCFLQNDCAPIGELDSNCIVTDESLSNPVTDWTGKTVFTKSSRTVKCTSATTVQTGCDEYQVSNNFGTVSYDTSSIGWRYSTYEGLEDATSHILMTEQMQHLFSGWAGYCEAGYLFSNPFNDPMKILSYAMMTYSAAGSDMFDKTIVGEAHAKLEGTFNNAASGIKETFGFGAATETAGNTIGSSFGDWITEKNILWEGSIGPIDLTLKYTALAEAAMSLAFPPEEEFIKADDLLKTWMGGSSEDNAALAYASCMASIGLSFPNLVSWSGGDGEGMSLQLKEPHNNPIRLTDTQIAILMKATSPEFVKVGLLPREIHGDSMTYLALTPAVYHQVGQVICSGRLAISQNILNNQATPPPEGGGANEGMIAAKLAISMLPPPYNLVASLILDILTSFEKGNACSSQDDAIKWGMIQFKTNQHLNFGQCHQTGSKCVAKWFWGSCMRTRHEYCCYDQIATRIMMEGLKAQLGRDWSNCSDVSINDFKNISFTPCKEGQDPFQDGCFPRSKYDEFIETMKRQASKGLDTMGMEDIVRQGINSMAIPGRTLEEMCADCD